MDRLRRKPPTRQLDSIIIHFDYDCFYASVFEHENPALKTLPLAVQQKQIVVTCNYEARRRGLSKLQLISEAKKLCPDVVIVLGEDLTRFRNASKQLYAFLNSFSWNSRCERLGFDEVFLDVTDIVDYNAGILNSTDLTNSFFCLSQVDPTVGFLYDASQLTGHAYPKTANEALDVASLDQLQLRLLIASHLAQHMRTRLESELGYTATVGVSTNKLLAKLVGNLQKPNGQTTLLPPYNSNSEKGGQDNVTTFIDAHEVGKLPGIGFKIAQKLRAYVLQRPADFDAGLVYGGTKENILVGDVRVHPGIGPEILERILSGPGTPQGIGTRIWGLLNGCDDTEVGQARRVPTQISVEDSYIRLDTLAEVTKEMRMLATSLLKRMHADLTQDDDEESPLKDTAVHAVAVPKRWLAHPKTIRLSTRPRPAQNPDGSRNRSFARISKSAPMPAFVFSLKYDMEVLVEKLVKVTLMPLFRGLHPERSGWNLSLVNVAATNMADAASEEGGVGRDISKMFKRQDDVLNQWKVKDIVVPVEVQENMDGEQLQSAAPQPAETKEGSEDIPTPSQEDGLSVIDHWESEDEDLIDVDSFRCEQCGAVMPTFARGAHYRWHAQK